MDSAKKKAQDAYNAEKKGWDDFEKKRVEKETEDAEKQADADYKETKGQFEDMKKKHDQLKKEMDGWADKKRASAT